MLGRHFVDEDLTLMQAVKKTSDYVVLQCMMPIILIVLVFFPIIPIILKMLLFSPIFFYSNFKLNAELMKIGLDKYGRMIIVMFFPMGIWILLCIFLWAVKHFILSVLFT